MTLLEKIREALQNLANLTQEQLKQLRADIAKAVGEVPEETSAENTAILNELADAMESAVGRSKEIEAEAAQAAADAQAARDRIAAIEGSDVGTEGGEAAPTGDDDPDKDKEKPEGEGEGEGAEEGAEAGAEAVAASGAPRIGSSASRMAAGSGRPAAPPEGAPQAGTRTTLVATGNLVGIDRGAPVLDREELGKAMNETLMTMDKGGRPQGKVSLVRADWRDQYPEDRRLSRHQLDAVQNRTAIDNVCAPRALVATGGYCAPVNVDWSIATWATAERPLRDGLPAFQADRGGLILRTPPDYSALLGATSVWTEATDADPGDATKPVLVIDCPEDQTYLVDAVPTRLGFGNMQSMFDPETVAANTDLALAAAANVAELNLWSLIQAQAVAGITTAATFGAARSFLSTLDRAVATYRNLHRLSDTQAMCAILPRWTKDLIRADRALELAHDSSGSVDPFGVTDEWIESQFSLRYVKPIWMLDSPASGSGYANQYFAPFVASEAAPSFPANLVWNLFVEGAVQFLDSGRLDLGVVRDSTLDATNDYETFVETFEGIANRVFANGILQFITTICANGESGATATTESCL